MPDEPLVPQRVLVQLDAELLFGDGEDLLDDVGDLEQVIKAAVAAGTDDVQGDEADLIF